MRHSLNGKASPFISASLKMGCIYEGEDLGSNPGCLAIFAGIFLKEEYECHITIYIALANYKMTLKHQNGCLCFCLKNNVNKSRN